METREQILGLLSSNREAIRKFGVREIGIFGSFARGEQRTDSDVDVLVDLDNNTFDAYMDLLFFLEDLFGRKVDLVDKDTIKPLIRNRILREALYVTDL
jgi:uncharacterized protein